MTNLAQAMYEQGLVCGFSEVRRLVHSRAVTVNGVPAESWDMPVKPGDVITCGKHKRMVVSVIDEPDTIRNEAVDNDLLGSNDGVARSNNRVTAEQVRKAIERHVKFYEGGDYDEQAIADELNATLEDERIKRLEKLIRAMYLDLLAEMPESLLEDRLIQIHELGIEVYGDGD